MMPDIKDIEKRRKQASLTQKELAVMSGVSQSIIAKIETGKVNPSYDVVRRIFEVFDNMTSGKETKAADLYSRNVLIVRKDDTVKSAVETMRKHGYSQMPVVDRKQVIGVLSEKTILDAFSDGSDIGKILKMKVEDVMEEAPPIIGECEPMATVSSLLQTNSAVLVVKKDRLVGIITKADLFKIAKK
jgi:predicted transcriptional regulator